MRKIFSICEFILSVIIFITTAYFAVRAIIVAKSFMIIMFLAILIISAGLVIISFRELKK